MSALQAIRVEGGIFPATLFQRLTAGEIGTTDSRAAASYGLVGSESVRDAANRAWSYLTGAWQDWRKAQAAAPGGYEGTAAALARDKWLLVLLRELDYGRLPAKAGGIQVGDAEPFPVSHLWQHVPIHLLGPGVDLDRRNPGVAGAARAPQAMVQDLLNRSDDHLWAIVSNGLRLRLLRDSTALAGSAFVEFDLEAIFDGELFAEFLLLWQTCHASRLDLRPVKDGDPAPADCWLELWRADSVRAGSRALERLRVGVENALQHLGTGFLRHPDNRELADALRTGKLTGADYHRHLLRLVYRLLFLFVTEDRNLLLAPGGDSVAAARYRDYLSTQRVRRQARQRHGSPAYADLWRGQRLVLTALGGDGEPSLGLPALGGLFDAEENQGEPLLAAELDNEAFLEAVRDLAWMVDNRSRVQPVDYRNLGAEELGGVYESLLELVPQVSVDDHTFTFERLSGNERKTTGSYYTPPALVSALLDSALDPVIYDAVRGTRDAAEAERALLGLTVCDPACGSGHFLVAAARRIARRLAAVRSGEEEPTPDAVRHALRDVVGRCVYGVDINPMAAELAKVSLWLEAMEPGKALGFLDARIRVGNSLLGATPSLLQAGVPDDAFKTLDGDDSKYAAQIKKSNRVERGEGRGRLGFSGQDAFDLDFGGGVVHDLAEERSEFFAVHDDVAAVRSQARRWRAYATSPDYLRRKVHADAWSAAFVWPLRPSSITRAASERDAVVLPPTSAVVRQFETDPDSVSLAATREQVEKIADEYRFFHWHLEFPEIFDRPGGRAGDAGWTGGFDAMLGNPPWERVKLQEQEFFAARDPEIAKAPNAAARKRLILRLADSDSEAERALYREYTAALRRAEGESALLRTSGSYPLAGRGDVNTYAVFTELFRTLTGPEGQAGIIVPTGIATDATTQHFFRDLVETRSIAALYDFENGSIFEAVDTRFKFCLLTMTGRDRAADAATFAFFLHDARDIESREFALTPEEITLLNPNTGTLPIFRARRDAEITLGIYRRVPVLIDEKKVAAGDPEGNPWGVKFMTMFHMSNDSHLFRTREQLEADGWVLDGNVFVRPEITGGGGVIDELDRYLPLYEAKMMHQYDHRWATYEPDGTVREVTLAEKQDPSFSVLPRYWVHQAEFDRVLGGRWDEQWLLGWRDIARATDERTMIAPVFPRAGVGNKVPLMLSPSAWLLSTVLNSFVADYVTRQSAGGTSLNYFIVKQVATATPTQISEAKWLGDSPERWLRTRMLELTHTSSELAGLGKEIGGIAEPFVYDDARRVALRAEVDAAVCHLYGLNRDEVEYVMGTFAIVRRKDESAYGEYRTKRLILENYDAIARAIATGATFASTLEPAPGDGPRHPNHNREAVRQ